MASKSKSRGIVYGEDGLFRRAGCICLDTTETRVSSGALSAASLPIDRRRSEKGNIQPGSSDCSKGLAACPMLPSRDRTPLACSPLLPIADFVGVSRDH